MKAAVLEQLNSPLAIRDVELTPLDFGQVKVKMLVSGICGAQLQEIAGNKGNAKFLPHLMGHEGCGIVEETGLGVTKVKPGDKVVCHWRVGSGIESPFPKYVLNGKTITSGKVTTFNECSIISENRLTVIPSDVPPVFGALLGCCITTAFGIINNDAEVSLGDTVIVVGCGGVGLNLIYGAQLAGASEIIGIDISDSKRSLALKAGATKFITIDDANLSSLRGDAVIDTTGNPDAIAKTIHLLHDNGRYVLVAHPKPGTSVSIPNLHQLFGSNGKTIVASQGGSTNPTVDIPKYVNLYKNGKLCELSQIVSGLYPLEDINLAIDTVRRGTVGRMLIQLNDYE